MYVLVRECFCLAALPWIYFWPVSSDVSHAEHSLDVVLVFFVTFWIGFVDLITCGGNFDSASDSDLLSVSFRLIHLFDSCRQILFRPCWQ